MPFQFPLLVLTRQRTKFGSQFFALFRRNEAGRSHRVNEQFQFRQFKPAVSPKIPVRTAHNLHYINAQFLQQCDITPKCFFIGGCTVPRKVIDNFPCSHSVILIRLYIKHPRQNQQTGFHFVLLSTIARHRNSFLSLFSRFSFFVFLYDFLCGFFLSLHFSPEFLLFPFLPAASYADRCSLRTASQLTSAVLSSVRADTLSAPA